MRWALLLLAACKHASRTDEMNEIAEAHRAAATATFAAIEQVARHPIEISTQPIAVTLTRDNAVVLPADAGAVHRLIADPLAYEAGVTPIYAWIGAPSVLAAPAVRLSAHPWPQGTAALDEGSDGVFDTMKKIEASEFAALADVKYVVLVDPKELQPLTADVGVFDLTGRSRGGVRIERENGEPMQAVRATLGIR